MSNGSSESAIAGEPKIHGTMQMIDGRVVLHFNLSLPHAVERVWRAVSVPSELERWFPAAVDWTPAVGETFDAGGATLEVTDVDAPHHLAWSYAGQLQSFELSGEGNRCRLTFAHVFDDLPLAAQTAAGWETYLSRLDPHLRGEHLTEATAHEQWAEIHERYAESFGVDPAPGRKFAEGMRSTQ